MSSRCLQVTVVRVASRRKAAEQLVTRRLLKIARLVESDWNFEVPKLRSLAFTRSPDDGDVATIWQRGRVGPAPASD